MFVYFFPEHTGFDRNVPREVLLFLMRIEIQNGRPGLRFAETFWSASRQVISLACHKCPSDDPNEVLLICGAILNLRMLS